MNLLHADAPLTLVLLGWLVAGVAVAHAGWQVRHGFLPAGPSQHAWLAAIVAAVLLWTLHVRSPVGLDFGLLGGPLFALVFGRARAILGLTAALLLTTALEQASWLNLGINAVVLAVVPAWIAATLQTQIERRLPRNLFVFIIGNGLFVTLIAAACTSLMVIALAAVEAPMPAPPVGDHIAYALLLAWGEALLSGMLFSALVVFAPWTVLTYRQDLYLPTRRRRI
jgi:uncharacterized membrane protein